MLLPGLRRDRLDGRELADDLLQGPMAMSSGLLPSFDLLETLEDS